MSVSSFLIARDHFMKARNGFDKNSDEEKYNLYSGLAELANAMYTTEGQLFDIQEEIKKLQEKTAQTGK